MKLGRPQRNYVGERFGIVTVIAHMERRRMLCRCDCGFERTIHVNNLLSSPPKKHSKCKGGFQYELLLDTRPDLVYDVRTPTAGEQRHGNQ